MNTNFMVNRGEIYIIDFGSDNKVGSEQRGKRAGIVIQNNIGNTFSPTVIVACITSQVQKKRLPTQVLIGTECGLLKPSMVMCEQTFTISKSRLLKLVGSATEEIMTYIDESLNISLELKKPESEEIKLAKAKAESINDLDKFIQMWLDKDKPIKDIYEFIDERRIKIKDLMAHCREHNLNLKDYYAQEIINSGANINNKIKMVG